MAEDSSLKALNMVEDKRTPIHRLGLPAETLQKLQLVDRSTKSLSSNGSDFTYCKDMLDLVREIHQHRLKWVELQWRIEARTFAMEMRALRDSSGEYDDWAKVLGENFGCVRAKVARATSRISQLQEDFARR
ncbi:MAG: hypothetical protein LQ349_007185 [Xanthoria aureola]|nr:MAG: hypothetical protein LQ349_007185 [Xanthoria aureola]